MVIIVIVVAALGYIAYHQYQDKKAWAMVGGRGPPSSALPPIIVRGTMETTGREEEALMRWSQGRDPLFLTNFTFRFQATTTTPSSWERRVTWTTPTMITCDYITFRCSKLSNDLNKLIDD